MIDLTIQDRVKRLYQSIYCGEHLHSGHDATLSALEEEVRSMGPAPREEPLFEPIGGGMCRLHLRPFLRTGLPLPVAANMFAYSAHRQQRHEEAFLSALAALPVNEAEGAWLDAYRQMGCPPVHHSDAFRRKYRPAYRVVQSIFSEAFSVLQRMNRLGSGVMAIDGPCASGKSTMAAALGAVFGAGVLHMDDFFLQPHQRTQARLMEAGGNFDRERFLAEVAAPLTAGHSFLYRPYSCREGKLLPPVAFALTPLVIIEGAYSMHPSLRALYGLSVFLHVDPAVQRARLLARNGPEQARRFHEEWIPMEQAYFAAADVAAACDLQLTLGTAGGEVAQAL